MKSNKARQAISKLPVAKTIVHNRALTQEIGLKDEEIQGLREAVERLEARNDEWAAEVRAMRRDDEPMHILWPAFPQDIVDADYRKPMPEKLAKKHKPPFTFNWVVPPVGSISGGHAVIMQTIHFLESKGNKCRIYFYDGLKQSSMEEIKKNLKNHVPIKAELFYNESEMADCDAIFATGWATAYPVFNFKGLGKKYYFLQDYEAMFEPSGSYNTLSDNTYKMGLQGIATSPYVADKVRKEYGMECDEYNLGFDASEYHITNLGDRKKIVFYARPVTPRRGFELGVLSLELFHKAHPEYEINFVGWDVERYEIPFPYVNNKILSVKQLNDLYNESAAGLAFSFTSMSLMPVEMLSSGCVPVVNDAKYTRMVNYSDLIYYAEPNPQAVADAVYEAANKYPGKKAADLSKRAQKYVWESNNEKLLNILLKELST